MSCAISTKSRYFLIAAVMAGIAAPVSAALWQGPDAASAPTQTKPGLDFTRFDAVGRIGADQAVTDPYCDHAPLVAANLFESYGESLQSSVSASMETHLDIWASESLGTWTAIYTRVDGVACVVGSGTDWIGDTSIAGVFAVLNGTL